MPNKTTIKSNKQAVTPKSSQIKNLSNATKSRIRYFQAEGDSMDNGSITKAILNGTVLKCTEIHKCLWEQTIFNKVGSCMVIIDQDGVIMAKQIADYNLATCHITLRSLNPKKYLYPDLNINLNDVAEVFEINQRII